MSLPDKTVGILTEVAQSVRGMAPKARLHEQQAASDVIKTIRVSAPGVSDDDLAGITYLIAALMSALSTLPPRNLALSLEGSFTAYALAAASLAGLYDLSGTPGDEGYVPGGYL